MRASTPRFAASACEFSNIGQKLEASLAADATLTRIWQTPYPVAVSTMNISLPESLKSFVDERVADGGYGTSSEYVRELIRRDQGRLQLRAFLLQGGASESASVADQDYLESLRARVRRHPNP